MSYLVIWITCSGIPPDELARTPVSGGVRFAPGITALHASAPLAGSRPPVRPS